MEKLDKVIAGLECCSEATDTVNVCPMRCPYYDKRDGEKVCLDLLQEDALELLREYQSCLTVCGIRQYGMEGLNGND